MTYWDGTRWVPDSPASAPAPLRRGRRFLGATAEALLVTGLVFGLIAGTTFAAKGGNRGSLDLVMVEETNLNGLPNYGETITFDVSTSATDTPTVNVRCHVGDALAYDGWASFYAWAWGSRTFTMASSFWSSGAADCVARLVMFGKNGRERTLTELPFHVDA
jgi:hypothetical protein